MKQKAITSRDRSTTKTPPRSLVTKTELKMWHRMLRHLSWIFILFVALIFGIVYMLSEGFRAETAEMWAILSSGDQQRIREYLRSYGALGPIVSVSLMALQAVIAPIPASVVQLANGVVYGVWGGALLNWIGQLTGAALAFYISRALGRTAADRLVGRIDSHGVVETWIDRWGTKALLVIRAVPGMPSDFVSYLMGLTPMRARRYLIYSGIGYIPQSFAYAWLGEYAIDWFWWIILAGFGVSGIIGLIVWAIRRYRRVPPRPALNIEPGRDTC